MKTSRAIAVLTATTLAVGLLACGRTPSRILGEGAAQVIEIDDMTRFISISFDKRGDSTVKDVTFLASDGYAYTQEFKDLSPLEGTIRWVPHGEGDSILQSRTISRWFGTAVNLELPENCTQLLGVDVTYNAKDERNKNVTCQTSDKKIKVREYREGFVDRHLEGWLEVRAKKK